MTDSRLTIHSIGHSTRSIDDFLDLLEAHAIRQVADVRTIPRSARHPQFSAETLRAHLMRRAVAYRHFPSLGGLRKPRAESCNSALRNASFRGYADHMQTIEFEIGVTELETFAAAAPTVVMCAEAVWWRCHRGLLADALLIRGVAVRHIMNPREANPHSLCEFARESGGKVIYPGLVK